MLHHVLHLDDNLTNDQLKKSLEKLFNNLVLKMGLNPAQQRELEAKKEEIIQQLFVALTSKDSKLTLNDFKNPALLNKLFVNLMVSVLHEKHFDKLFTDKLIHQLKTINPKFDPTTIKGPQDLEKFFTKEQLEKMLTPEVLEKGQAFNQELCQQLSPFSNKPDILKQKTGTTEQKEDPYTNLFGLICSATTGGLVAVVTQYFGNAGNLTDWNPLHGLDNIGSINDPNDRQFDDPLGLIADTISNYLQADSFSADLVTEMQEYVRVEAPKPRPFEGG